VLTSVHAFATDPARGSFILGFLGVVVGGSLALFGWRAPRWASAGRFDRVSRESLLLGNNVLLVAACGAVMLGTLYPLAARRAGPGQDLGRRALLRSRVRAADGAGGAADGRRPAGALEAGPGGRPGARLRWPALASVVAAVALPLWAGRWSLMVGAGPAAGGLGLHQHRGAGAAACAQPAPGGWLRAAGQSRSFWGMVLAHLGVGVFIVGVTMVKGYEVERDVKMRVGDSVGWAATPSPSRACDEVQGPNYVACAARSRCSAKAALRRTMHPEKRASTRCSRCR
jgi:cytochrome c-type biogenesis protein CcmF